MLSSIEHISDFFWGGGEIEHFGEKKWSIVR